MISVLYRAHRLRAIPFSSTSVRPTSTPHLSKRNLGVHEYQSMALLRDRGINVPRGRVCHNPDEVFSYANNLMKDGVRDFVVKAQVLTGGRGRGNFDNGFNSGVHLVYSPEQASSVASNMIGNRLITKQTTSRGLPCDKVYLCERLYSRREFYLAMMLDRVTAGPIIIGSSQGGVNIEDVAKENPEAIKTVGVNIFDGLGKKAARDFLERIGFTEECLDEAADQLIRMYKLFVEKDCTMVEINPFCETNDGQVYCFDCKLQFDLNAVFRQPDVPTFIDNSQVDPREVEATANNLNYVGLDGNIGCLVNGAGLAMSTMDIIKLNGGSPANFLDVGGGATANQVHEAFRIITNDEHVKAIFVNIFGGIMRCDVIAEGIIDAAKSLDIKIPIVVRLQGTNMDEARALISSSGLRIIPVNELDSASKLVCQLAHIVTMAHDAQVHVNFELPI